uniref:Uncharacterized protein n=1 Tax=Siphoviridae sp. ctkyp1 TaxID=2825646 RepID=A0A8S5P3P8_9CAUD|nr:MAG TPA: hypothetical protein [Siphoviridae sp. ctkyp1]
MWNAKSRIYINYILILILFLILILLRYIALLVTLL